MRLTTTLVCSFLFFFAQISFLPAQSSIYQDAKAMAAFMKQNHPPEVRFYFSPGSKGRGVVSNPPDSVNNEYAKRYSIPYFGSWTCRIEGGQPGDQIRMQVNDTLLLVDFTNTFEKVELVYADTLSRVVASYQDTTITLLDPDLHPLRARRLGIQSQVQDAIFTLGAHAAFEQISAPDFHFKYSDIFQTYASNPYISRYLYNSPFLNTDQAINQLNPNLAQALSKDFPGFYLQKYPWQKYINGDTVVALQPGVSIEAVSTSYRQQIVTSQDELIEASAEINNTNRRRGALDAKTIAIGLSDFVAERAQEELNLTFFNRFKKNLDQPSELTKLFPETKDLLYQFEISNYKTLLAHARESFTTDLKSLGVNFPKILDLKKYRDLKNDPNVFNLSLIYRIADLAYKEQPIETILLAGHQVLQQRKKYLDKSINLAIADTIVVEKDNRTVQAESPEQQKLKRYVENYLESIKTVSDNLESSMDVVYSDAVTRIDLSNDDPMVMDYLGTFRKSVRTLQDARPLLKATQPAGQGIEYQNRLLEDATPYSHYKKVIPSNLSGKAYYGYLIDDPRAEDFEVFFKPNPKLKAEYIARGIEETRELLDQHYDEKLLTLQEIIQARYERNIAEEAKIRQLMSYSVEQNACAMQLYGEIRLVEEAIQAEIDLWQSLTGLDGQDHYIAGLYFLKALLDKDIYIDLFTTIGEESELGGRDVSQIIFEDYRNTLGEDFYGIAEIAEVRLDSVVVDFETQVEGMVKALGSMPVEQSTYETLRADRSHTKEIKLLEKEQSLLERDFTEQSREVEDQFEAAIEENPDIIELQSQLVSLNEAVRQSEAEAEKQQLNDQIDSLNQLQNEIMERMEASVEEQLETLEIEKTEALAEIQNQIDSLANMPVPDISAPVETGGLTKKPIQAFYNLKDNLTYQNLLQYREEDYRNEGTRPEAVEQFIQRLEEEKKQVLETKQHAQVLRSYLDTLANQFCPKLIDAKTNAEALTMGLELSTHLFFAFRNYEHTYDTLYYEDTVRVTVTTTQLDSLTGLTSSFTSDTLKIIRKPIEGTMDPVLSARWLTRKEFDALRKNEVQWDFFLGLIYQRMRSVKNAPRFSPEGIALLTTKFFKIANEVELTRRELRLKKSIDPDGLGFKDYYPIIRSTVDLFNTVITTRAIDTADLTQVYPQLKNIPRISDEALSLYENIYVTNYANAVLNAMELLKLIQSGNISKGASRSINAVLTYGTFMADMIDAQTSEQVKAILKAATLPPGSSRIKREVVSNFTINSYLGLTAGRDRLLDAPADLDAEAFGAALSLPIGFTYSFSPKFIKNKSSLSVHIPVLDLGAITAFRQNPDNARYQIDDLPDFEWRNLLSPGAFAVYNFANGPLSVGVGGQYGPQLREIQTDTGGAIFLNSWRFPMAFINIDVPLFNLYTGPRKILIE